MRNRQTNLLEPLRQVLRREAIFRIGIRLNRNASGKCDRASGGVFARRWQQYRGLTSGNGCGRSSQRSAEQQRKYRPTNRASLLPNIDARLFQLQLCIHMQPGLPKNLMLTIDGRARTLRRLLKASARRHSGRVAFTSVSTPGMAISRRTACGASMDFSEDSCCCRSLALTV
jgi:hypothetical protein